MVTQPVISRCTLLDCSYNHEGCQALAMNMGTKGCTTFIALPQIGGRSLAGAVGACQKADCAFNNHLECQADSVEVGGPSGECLTYKVA